MDVGDIRLGKTFDVKITTITSTGAPITLAGGAVSVYADNSTTEITAGVTLTTDFDGRTGMHNVRVVATSGNGYATATNYSLVMTAGTVDSISVVGYVIGTFSIENRSAVMPYTADRTLAIDQLGMVSSGGYTDAAVWIDTVNGSSGTTVNIDGTQSNPVGNLADALTIAAAVGLRRFAFIPGSSVTLASTYTGWQFVGTGWTLALGTQACTDCTFDGAIVSGTVTGTGNSFSSCNLGAVTLPPCSAYGCLFTNTVTCGSAGTYNFEACSDGRAPGLRPNIDLGAAVGATEVHINDYYGEIAFQNILAGDEVDVYGMGVIELAVSCTAGELTASPDFTVLNSGTTTVTRTTVGMGSLRVGTDVVVGGSIQAVADFYVGGNATVVGTTTHTGAVLYTGTVTAANAGNNFRINGVAPGAAGGVLIAGSNAATTFATLTVTSGATMNITGTLSGNVGGIATGGITSASFAANSLTATAVDATVGAEISDAVWDEVLAGHLTAGSTGAALNAAGAAGDPWSTAIPGAYAAGTAGHRLGNVPDVAAGASGGILIAGSNAATTVAALTVSGDLTVDGIAIASDITGGSLNFGSSSLGTVSAVSVAVATTTTFTGNVTYAGTVTHAGATTFTGAVTAVNAANAITLGAAERAAIVSALASSIIKGTYTFADLEKDLAAAIGGVVTDAGLTYAVPSLGWSGADTTMGVSGVGGDRQIVRS